MPPQRLSSALEQARKELGEERLANAASKADATATASDLRADWSQWRGAMDATVHASAQRIAEMDRTMQSGLARIERMVERGFEAQAAESAAIKEQTTLTNGSVRELKEWRARLEGSQEGEQRIEARVEITQERALQRFQFRANSALQLAAAVLSGGVVAWVLHAVHLV